MAESIKRWRWPASCSPPLSTPPESKWHSELLWKILLCDRLSLSGMAEVKRVQIPPSWHPRQAQANASQVFGRISALIWPRSASDWGVLAACARLTPKSLEKFIKYRFVASATALSTPITFYVIQRNLVQLCFKGRLLAFFLKMFLRKWGFLKHITPSVYNH